MSLINVPLILLTVWKEFAIVIQRDRIGRKISSKITFNRIITTEFIAAFIYHILWCLVEALNQHGGVWSLSRKTVSVRWGASSETGHNRSVLCFYKTA